MYTRDSMRSPNSVIGSLEWSVDYLYIWHDKGHDPVQFDTWHECDIWVTACSCVTVSRGVSAYQNLLSRLGLASVPPRTLVTPMRLEALTNPLAGRSHG